MLVVVVGRCLLLAAHWSLVVDRRCSLVSGRWTLVQCSSLLVARLSLVNGQIYITIYYVNVISDFDYIQNSAADLAVNVL